MDARLKVKNNVRILKCNPIRLVRKMITYQLGAIVTIFTKHIQSQRPCDLCQWAESEDKE